MLQHASAPALGAGPIGHHLCSSYSWASQPAVPAHQGTHNSFGWSLQTARLRANPPHQVPVAVTAQSEQEGVMQTTQGIPWSAWFW